MSLLSVNGHAIAMEERGEGPLAVFAHCALAKRQALRPLARQLDVTARLIDLPGHGESSVWDGQADYQALTRDAIDAAIGGDGPAHVIGHSFGATAALRLAVERPERVSRLTLIEPVYFAAARGSAAHDAHREAFDPFEAALRENHRAVAAERFNALWGGQPWAEIGPRTKAYLTDRIHLIAAGGGAIEDDPEGITLPERLAEVRRPVTLIRGTASPPVMTEIVAQLAAALPQAGVAAIEGAGHMAPLTHVEAVAEAIRAAGGGA